MTISEAYIYAVSKLTNVKFIENPKTEAEILILSVLNIDRKDFILEKDKKEVNSYSVFLLNSLLKKRIRGKSISGIIGKKYFYDDEFIVDMNVLIPRPETELLVETALNSMYSFLPRNILDIGTGSGIIAITLSRHFPDSTIDAIDKSLKALKIAKKNIASKNISNVNPIRADFFKYRPSKKYDLIVSNPPYIPRSEVKILLKEKVVSDPEISLDGGKDGLDFYRCLKIFSDIFLNTNGFLIMEHGKGQRESIIRLFDGKSYETTCYNDHSEIDRIIRINKV
jgi:release factor glutamine methyltransferase